MGDKFKSAFRVKEMDLSASAKSFIADRNNVQTRVGNSRYPLEQLTQAVNNLEARQPRMLFSQSVSHHYSYWGYADPLLEWQFQDYNYNGRTIRYDIIASTNDDDYTSDHYAWKSSWDNSDYQTHGCSDTWGPPWLHLSFTYDRGDMTNTVITDGISQQVGDYATNLKIWDISVQEEPIEYLDSEEHRACIPYNNRSGEQANEDDIERLRKRFHEIRSQNLPQVLSWSAQTEEEGETSGSTHCHSWGIHIASTSNKNIWDGTSATRTATTPGSMFFGYNAGIGNEANNRNIHCVVAAKIRYNPDSEPLSPAGYVTFEGPDHVAGNTCELTTTSEDWEWVGGTSSDFIYLNSASEFDDTSTEMNKIDIFGRATTDTFLQIAGVCAWIEYNKN